MNLLQHYAELGAKQRLAAIQEETRTIHRLFPNLQDVTPAPLKRTRPYVISAKSRRAIGLATKKRWIAYRKLKALQK